MSARFFLMLVFCVTAFSAFAENSADTINIPVPAHDIARGDVIAAQDLVYQAVPALQANASVARSMADLVGQETRRALRAGEFVRTSDVRHPILVAKGATVTMLFEAPGLTLTAVGRAMGEGGQGDSITVLNPVSYRQVAGVVVAPGTVRVGSADTGASLAAADAAQPQ